MLHFYKYHGTGNDFIIIDNREGIINLTTLQIAGLCHRNFGIGADGLMLLENSNLTPFKMRYFNSDGREGSMCGNGGRCLVAFAKKLNLVDGDVVFEAIDGIHHAFITDNAVHLKMNDVKGVEKIGNDFFLDTGSPHYVSWVTNIADMDVVTKGRSIRYNKRFFENGTNVNFIEKKRNQLFIRTYERGVENETLSCGTGTVAAAIISVLSENSGSNFTLTFQTKGGELTVRFNRINDNTFQEIWLEGPAQFVFEGSFLIE